MTSICILFIILSFLSCEYEGIGIKCFLKGGIVSNDKIKCESQNITKINIPRANIKKYRHVLGAFDMIKCEYFPTFFFKGILVTVLNISHNNLRILQSRLLEHQPRITFIDLSYNRLNTIEVNFWALTRLKKLDLSHNVLGELGSGAFYNLISNQYKLNIILDYSSQPCTCTVIYSRDWTIELELVLSLKGASCYYTDFNGNTRKTLLECMVYGNDCESNEDGYFGPECTNDALKCKHRNCAQGTCRNLRIGSVCSCEGKTYKGNYCNLPQEKVCEYNCTSTFGTCGVIGNNDYVSCICKGNSYGNNCQYVDYCSTKEACNNRGNCSYIRYNGKSNFYCDCLPQFYGDKCQHATICISNTCLNKGQCIETMFGGYICKCPEYFYGDYCQYETDCRDITCLPFGKCIHKHEHGKRFDVCKCNKGYFGYDCRYKKCENNRNYCQLYSSCKFDARRKMNICDCRLGTSGNRCQFSKY